MFGVYWNKLSPDKPLWEDDFVVGVFSCARAILLIEFFFITCTAAGSNYFWLGVHCIVMVLYICGVVAHSVSMGTKRFHTPVREITNITEIFGIPILYMFWTYWAV